MKVDELARLGLYEPDAPGAEERLALLRLALEYGATEDEIRQAIAERRLHVLAADRLALGGRERLTLAEAAARASIELRLAERVWRALGFAAPGDARVCTEHDVGVLAFHVASTAVFGEEQAVAMARAAGAGLDRNADAIVGVVRSALEVPIRATGGGGDAVARSFVDAASRFLPLLYPMFEAVHRRHLTEATRRYALWGVAPTAEGTSDVIVGFADVVGYTERGEQLSVVELDRLVATFEERCTAAIARPGARLVKLIGDAAMFVAGDAADAVDIARQLIADPELPPLRVGLAAGRVVAREGDFYGAVVNLAARLVTVAGPDGVLLDAEAARRLGAGATVALGERRLRGFADPVDVFALRGPG